MNSEELELSLRTEFESYLKSVLAEIRQEATEFQGRIQADLDKQKAQFDEAFGGFAARFDSERTFDEAFKGSVSEHLSLARDEGARLAANAMAEAEKLGAPAVPVAAPKYDAIRDAVADITSKTSQSTILKALVQNAAEFAPRGAFFIIKNEHFVGWKVFGADNAAEDAIRDIHFPTSADTTLGSAVVHGTSVEVAGQSHAGDASFLVPLQFGQPDNGLAMPLVARGRGVAVLYADNGSGEGSSVNREALETLVRVAGLTVELLASTQSAKAENRTVAPADFEDADLVHRSEQPAAVTPEAEPRFDETIREMPVAVVEEPLDSGSAGFAFTESVSFEGGFPQETARNPFDAEPAAFVEPAAPSAVEENVYESSPFDASPFGAESVQPEEPVATFEPVVETYEPVASYEPEPVSEVTSGEMIFDAGTSLPPPSSPFDQAPDRYEPAGVGSSSGFGQQVAEPVVEMPVAAVPQPRLSDRMVDLPIEVPEEERRIHNDARRFARLLVSEIKLYNEKKVIEGREASDLYDRLREAIDRSREMYDKRVQPPVAAKFDYFHYEIVNSLANGDANRLGSSYPGASV